MAGREDKLSADNRLVVNSYQEDLAKRVGSLCQMVETSMSRQNEHLQGVENLCHSFLLAHEKVLYESLSVCHGFPHIGDHFCLGSY